MPEFGVEEGVWASVDGMGARELYAPGARGSGPRTTSAAPRTFLKSLDQTVSDIGPITSAPTKECRQLGLQLA